MERNPNVSVVIPCFNMGDMLPDAIESVFNQTYKDYEIIVVDDGSEDRTGEIVSKYKKMGVKYIYQNNSGESAARNTGIRHSKGRYIAFLDADDMWLPEKLDRQIKLLARFNIGAVACGYKIIDYNSGHAISEVIRKNYPDRETLFKNLCIKQIIPGSSSGMIIEKDYFRRIGYFNESLKIAADWELWLRIAKRYDIKFVEKTLAVIRINMKKPSFRVPSREEYYVSKVINEHVPKRHQKKAYAALYARLGSNCLVGYDKKKALSYLLRSILIHPLRIYSKDKDNAYKYPQVWRYYLLFKSVVPDSLLKIIKDVRQ